MASSSAASSAGAPTLVVVTQAMITPSTSRMYTGVDLTGATCETSRDGLGGVAAVPAAEDSPDHTD